MLSALDVLYPEGAHDDALVADVDWATGTIRMHVLYDVWQAASNKSAPERSADDEFLSEIVTHEFTHVLQMVRTGYAYRLSHRILREVAEAVRAGETLESIYMNRAAHALHLRPVLQSLEQTGPGGLRPIDILESVAFLTQKRTHYPGLGPRSYERMLLTVPDAAYRRAYDLAAEVLSEDAFEQLPQIAELSLYTSRPESVFVALLHAFHDEGSRLDWTRNQEIGLRLIHEHFPKCFLGSASDQLEANVVHPLLEATVRDIRDLINDGVISDVGLVTRPFDVPKEIAALLMGPLLFPRDGTSEKVSVYIPRLWHERAQRDSRFSPEEIPFLTAASALVVNDIEPVPLQKPGAPARESSYDYFLAVRSWEFPVENRTEATANRLAEIVTELESDPPKARALRGTVAISVPDADLPAPLLSPEVRGFFRLLFDRIPPLLYFLSEWRPAASMLICAAAYCKPDDISESDDGHIRVNFSAEVAVAVSECFLSAVIFCARVGDDYRWLIKHLDSLPDQLSRLLRKSANDAFASESSRLRQG